MMPGWWKLRSLAEWLSERPSVTAVAWMDDDLRGGRSGAARRAFAASGVGEVLLTRPRTPVGLTPAHVARLERWVERLSS